MKISMKREQNSACIGSAEREKFGAKLKTKNIFKALALAMLMPAMLLTSACSNDDDVVNNEPTAKKGYALPVTVNVTRGGDATRATFNESTRKLEFSAGDKLFVSGYYGVLEKRFAGTLEYDTESGKFSGTIYTQDDTYSTYEALFAASASEKITATLLPAGYEDHGYLVINTNDPDAQYDDYIEGSYEYTLATSKADGVAQFSYEQADSYSDGFALSPKNAILNFTITGLAVSTNVAVSLTGMAYNITGTVTTDASGTATFAAGIMDGLNLKPFSLTVAGNPITLVSSDKYVAKGKIYNITRLIGQFSVSDTKKVYFSKGNLQATYNGSNWSWAFAEHQWDYIGNAAGNTMVTATSPFINGNATVDLFGWVGASSNWADNVNKYGITSSSATNNKDGYGNVADETLKSDWGTLIGSGWRTLSMDEWTYLLNTRTVNGGTGADKSYTLNQSVNGKTGMVIYPDNYTGAVYSGSDWASFEAAGCVFLPAAGWRNGTTINNINDRGFYWSTTPSNETAAKRLFFAGGLDLTGDNSRAFGFSVRLVREVE